MNKQDQQTKKQRDQFLAFSLASTDLLMEIDGEGTITFALGAPKLITGYDDAELLGKNWLELFSEYDQEKLAVIHKESIAGKRCGPLLIELSAGNDKRKGVFTALKMPGKDNFYITLALSNKLMSKLAAAPKNTNKELSDHNQFLLEAEKAFDFGRSIGIDPDITTFDFGFTQTLEDEIGVEATQTLEEAIRDILQSSSLNNTNPCKLCSGSYALIHDDETEIEIIKSELQAAIDHYTGEPGKYTVEENTIESDLSSIGNWAAEKALDYLVTNYDPALNDDDDEFKIVKLNDARRKHGAENVEKVKKLKDMIERVDFTFTFKPVASLSQNEVIHYEMIPVFPEGKTREWLILAEDANLHKEFDNAYLERAINHISFKSGGGNSKFSANIYAANLSHADFTDELLIKLDKTQGLANRLSFEISHFDEITDKDKALKFLTALKERGHKLIFGDVSTTSNSALKAHSYGVDSIRIGKRQFSDILNSQRTFVNLKAFVNFCHKHNIQVTACGVDTLEIHQKLNELGIDYGRGLYIGEPQTTLSYKPPER